MMNINRISKTVLNMILAVVVTAGCIYLQEPVYATSEKNKESIVTDVKNPANGVITYKVTVPPGEKIDYSVQVTPDKKYKSSDIKRGSYKNKTKKTVKKDVTVRVNCFSDRYKISASYTTSYKGEEITYTDVDKAVSALKTSVVSSKMKWDFSKLGKGEKEWKYRYKFVPSKDGIKKYVEVFNKSGKRIKYYVKETLPITKNITLNEILRAR